MCGIAGILRPEGSGPPLSDQLRVMQARLRHRGPDDEGLWVSPDNRAGFAHTRLSILDLSPAGHQPMHSPDGRFTLTFNGEIYNFLELRGRLEAQGAVFRTRTDTEVILRLYESEGPACLDRLRGMFALAIWDDRDKAAFLARDPLGIKPLYYAVVDGTLVFASELRALLAAEIAQRQVNPRGLLGYYLTGSVPEPDTVVRGVYLLPGGSSLLWSAGEVSTRKYWSLQFTAGTVPPPEAADHARAALLDSVRHHFVSDVPVGIFLSGGLDSTVLVALARAVGVPDVRTFSISFDNPALDEGGLAARTAAHFNTRHADWRMRPDEGRVLFETYLHAVDQPSVDGFNTYTVSRFAHDQAMKVVLSGLGGDELFAGYPSFRLVPALLRWHRRLERVPLRAGLGRLLMNRGRRAALRRLGQFLVEPPSPLAAYRSVRGIFTRHTALMLTARHAEPAPEDLQSLGMTLAEQPTLADQISAFEVEYYMRNQLLRDSDVMSMAWGLELRVPFVDRTAIESLARISAAVRLAPGKGLLKAAVPELPEWILRQRKRGFTFPFQEWVQAEWREIFESEIQAAGLQPQGWYQSWSIFLMEHFLRANGIQENH
jgi:asparagine synthase (glutamine-hydrolysing)